MVKIINTLGEVKIGKQGEVVYQRKYGQQIRRQVSPKRAIPSQTQIAHRQLYRDALTWRSNLSLANRRYLDGYCIANGVVDRYHIPLPWSRFALKIYLQAVKFLLLEKAIPAGEGVSQKKQSYDATSNWDPAFGSNVWLAQTFLTTDAYTITSVKVKLQRADLPGTITVSIRDAQTANKPEGSDLTSGTTDGNTLPLPPDFEMREIHLTPYDLLPNHRYAIVTRREIPITPTACYWAGRSSDPRYPDGRACYSTDSGASWGAYDTADRMFETWALVPGTPAVPGLLHVRHPALLTVIHKRGELPINAYYNLSSLDNEYLTKQVGLDFLSGDKIEATTVAGILYKHQV